METAREATDPPPAPDIDAPAESPKKAWPNQETGPQAVVTLSEAWSQQESKPMFFRRLEIAEDGGLSNVDSLFETSRFVSALSSIGMMAVNIWFLVGPNVQALQSNDWTIPKTNNPTLINRVILHNTEKELNAVVMVALLELLLLAILLAQAGYEIGRSLTLSRRNPAHSWNAAAQLFFELVPELSSMSAMRLLTFVTPAIFIPAITIEVKGVIRRHGRRYGLPLFIFLLKRLVAGVVGFDAFLVKFYAATDQARASDLNTFNNFLSSAAFLNQVLGVVQVARYARKRLLVYIFGGVDGYIDEREKLRQLCYHAMLVSRVWKCAAGRQFARSWFFAIMFSYTDYDFQSLTLHEKSTGQQAAAQPDLNAFAGSESTPASKTFS